MTIRQLLHANENENENKRKQERGMHFTLVMNINQIIAAVYRAIKSIIIITS